MYFKCSKNKILQQFVHAKLILKESWEVYCMSNDASNLI